MANTLASDLDSNEMTRPSRANPGTEVVSLSSHSDASNQAVSAGTPTSKAIGIGSTAIASIAPAAASR
jgi:hypothetical protein